MTDLSPIGRTHTEAVAERMQNPEYLEEYERIRKRRGLRELLDRSSVGTGLRDIEERGIEAHLKDLEQELQPKWKRQNS